ncbi:MAG: hypothetical protein FWF44_03710 [Defluviitaleaceae bacterium]|nr:hypothetical protein [Defluviitaleaceae bacterium]
MAGFVRKNVKWLLIVAVLVIVCAVLTTLLIYLNNGYSAGQTKNIKTVQANNNISQYANPIDDYFMPRLANASPEIAYRELQDNYETAWETEFDNVINWMSNKCQYQEDKDKIEEYVSDVNKSINAVSDIVVTDWLGDYLLPPDSPERNVWGTGTRSGLNQLKAEIYRDASMRLIENCPGYSFRNIDYSRTP